MPDHNLAEATPGIHSRLLSDVQDQNLELPTLPESNARIETITAGEAVNLREFSQVVAQDPGLACKLLHIANSAHHSVSQPVGSINLAIKQLGLRYASELAAGLSNQLVFQPTNEMIERRYRMAVADSTYVAAAAAVLARNYTEMSAERARLAGLFHNIGAFPILAKAEYENFTDTFALQDIVETVQIVLSAAILKRWNFPKDIVDIPTRLKAYARSGSELELVDLVVAGSALNTFFNHEEVARSKDSVAGDPATRSAVMPQSLSLLIYEIAGFDPLSNTAQVQLLREEIAREQHADERQVIQFRQY